MHVAAVLTVQLVHYLESGAIVVQLWGKQKAVAPKKAPGASAAALKASARQSPAASVANIVAANKKVSSQMKFIVCFITRI